MRFASPGLPVWLECGERFTYGMPADDGQGFKFADDTPGAVMDPTSDERLPTTDGIERARQYLAGRIPRSRWRATRRFGSLPGPKHPGLTFPRRPSSSRLPRLDRRRRLRARFKMGPAIGESLAALVLGESTPDPQFTLERFKTPPAEGWALKWS